MDGLTQLQILQTLQIWGYQAIANLPFLLILALGAAIGSFLNVVVYRLPEGLSLIHPPSRCPHCHHQLGPTENIPIWGWLRLKGRCKSCRAGISIRYPLVEAATAVLFLLVFAVTGFTWTTLGYWIFFSWLLALALIDLDTMTLPLPLMQSGLLLGIGFAGGLGVVQRSLPEHLMGSMGAAVLGIWLLGLIRMLGSRLLKQDAMGAGDSKLAAMMGAWLGWKLLLLSLFLAALTGAIAGGLAMALGRLQQKQAIPFGPFLALGAAISALWGQGVIELYQSFF